MFSCRFIALLLLLIFPGGCGDNLFPSGADKRSSIQAGSSGSRVGQKPPVFTVFDSSGGTVTLTSATAGKKGAAFYFTMWCPICDSHMSTIRSSIAPAFPQVNFFLVDYVSGSITGTASAASANGYNDGVFTTLADTNHTLTNIFLGTMGTTIVIDSSGTVTLNEDFRDGTNLRTALSTLP